VRLLRQLTLLAVMALALPLRLAWLLIRFVASLVTRDF
jgi:hypothetical protein